MNTNRVLRNIQDFLPGIRSPGQEIERRIPRDLIEELGKKPDGSMGPRLRRTFNYPSKGRAQLPEQYYASSGILNKLLPAERFE